MQTQQLPEVGKTYISKTDTNFSIYVETVDLIEADGEDAAGFCVTGCAPKDRDNEGAPGYELMNYEWESSHFVPLA